MKTKHLLISANIFTLICLALVSFPSISAPSRHYAYTPKCGDVESTNLLARDFIGKIVYKSGEARLRTSGIKLPPERPFADLVSTRSRSAEHLISISTILSDGFNEESGSRSCRAIIRVSGFEGSNVRATYTIQPLEDKSALSIESSYNMMPGTAGFNEFLFYMDSFLNAMFKKEIDASRTKSKTDEAPPDTSTQARP